jgi:Flp pilus assembly protein TadD
MKVAAHCVLAAFGALCTLNAQSLADGIAAVESGRLDDAVRLLEPLARQQPKSFEPNFFLGLAHFRAGRAVAARPFLKAATDLAPSNAQAWKVLGLANTSAGDLDAAASALGKACDLAPRDEEACYYLARTLYAQGHYQAARAPFEKALKSAPDEMRLKVHRAIALNFAGLGAAEDAERHFQEAIRLMGPGSREPEDPRVDYGAFLFRQGRTGAALAPLQEAVRNAPSSARANLELGRVLLHLEKTGEAAGRLETAVRLAPADFNAHLLLGRAYLKLGRTAEGEREMKLGQEGWAAKR